MKMIKFIGIITVISISAFAGLYFSSSLKNRVVMLKKLNYMLDEIMIMLRYRSATVYEIAEALAADERFTEYRAYLRYRKKAWDKRS